MNHDLVVEQSAVGSARVLTPAGDIDMARAPTVRKAVIAVLRDQPTKLVIDLTSVRYVDSSGIATLVEALQLSMRQKVKFVLVGISPRVQSAFEITKLVGLFTVCASVSEATATP